MSERLMTFDEFRLSNHDVLRTQRELLHDDERTADILITAAKGPTWPVWPPAVPES